MNLLKAHFERCLNATYEERENGASVACEREGERLYLLFQHSKGMTDWLNNLNFHAVPYKSMKPVWQCHGGFLKAWKESSVGDRSFDVNDFFAAAVMRSIGEP